MPEYPPGSMSFSSELYITMISIIFSRSMALKSIIDLVEMHGKDNPPYDYYYEERPRERSRDKMHGRRDERSQSRQDYEHERRYSHHRPSYQRSHGYRDSHHDGNRHSRHRSRSHSRQRRQYQNYSHVHSNSSYYHQSQQQQIDQSYPQKTVEQNQQRLRIAIRNNQIQFNPKLLEMLRNFPTSKQEQLTEQAHSQDKINQCILVRELFISGLADMNEHFISEIMKQYGEIEKIEIIKNFAYVKFHKVEDASNACAEYHTINMRIHNIHNTNFKIFFSDHIKRWNVVSNNIKYENIQELVPVVYVSIKNQKPYNSQEYLRGVFKKFGYLRNIELKLSEPQGMKVYKSYALAEYETLEQAMRAKERIKGHRERYLGDRKSQITLLIDSDKITKSCANVKNQLRYQKKRQINTANNSQNPQMMSNTINPYIGQVHRQNVPINPIPQEVDNNNQIFELLREYNEKQVNVENQSSDWVGFLTRNKQFKVEVDFNLIHKVSFELESVLNVSNRADLQEAITREDYVVTGKFRAANSLNIHAFNEYIKYFIKKNRAGIILSKKYLIYLIPPVENLPLPYPIKQDEILALFYKNT